MKMSHLQLCLERSNWEADIRLPEHGKETEVETHPTGRTVGPKAEGDGAVEAGWEDVAGVAFAWRCRQPGASTTPGRTAGQLE